ncbi:MAG: integration host factor subunit beta [Planctomycetes bacterium]|nr:integration host factor subunit beta [Planctomycetota bacterium]
MTKKDIVKQIASELNVSQNLVYEIVQRTFDGITDTLVNERRIELRNFGVFEIRLRAPRKARNPRTNERVDVPERVAVSFKAGKEMAQRIAAIQPNDLAAPAAKPDRPEQQGSRPSVPPAGS